jgi:hypothetical protein
VCDRAGWARGVEVRVVRARDRVSLLGNLRLALGLVAAGLASARVDRGHGALGLVLGAVGFVVIGTLRQPELARGDVTEGLPRGAVVVHPVGAALRDLLPSSVGDFVLSISSVVVEPLLAPLLAGLLIGMGLATLPSLAQIMSRERQGRHRIYPTIDSSPRSFLVTVAPTEPASRPHA